MKCRDSYCKYNSENVCKCETEITLNEYHECEQSEELTGDE